MYQYKYINQGVIKYNKSYVGERLEEKIQRITSNKEPIKDARRKSHHAPILEEDSTLMSRVESLAAPGGPLHGLY